MNDKYYTPDINEFYVGFEYEIQYKNWEKPTHFNFTEIDNLLSIGNLRVKYLDKTDIENLGFEFINQAVYTNNIQDENILEFKKWNDYYKKENTTLLGDSTDDMFYDFLDYNIKTKELIIHNNESFEDYYQRFEGMIKNKSELKILLKQLSL